MGGYGSGRSTGRPTTESGLTLTLSKLLRDKLFRPGCVGAGSLIWTNTSTGERIGSIGYEAHLGEENGRVRLHYTTTRRDGEKRDSDCWIQLETTPQPFGGRRWWFTCPWTGVRAAKLHLPEGALTFASRQGTGSRTNANANPAIIGLCGVLSSCVASSGGQAQLKTTFPSRNGCARQPTTASARKSSPPRRSWKPTRRISTASSSV